MIRAIPAGGTVRIKGLLQGLGDYAASAIYCGP